MSFQHALQMIRREGGLVSNASVTLPVQTPEVVPFEQSFVGHFAKERRQLATGSGRDRQFFEMDDSYSFDFDGVGFAVMGTAQSLNDEDYVFEAELHVDGELVETATWPTNFVTRRFYLFWKYELPDGQHSVEVKILNPSEDANVLLDGITIYGTEELASNWLLDLINEENF